MSAPDATLARVREVYSDCPDWIEALAIACDASSQTSVAERLDYSRTVINLVVNGRYDRDMSEVERRVREMIIGRGIVTCPIRGEITTKVCKANQALPFSNSNSERVALYRACHGRCPHSAVAIREMEAGRAR